MKKIISRILTAVITISLLSTCVFAANPITFKDVKGDEYFFDAAVALSKLKILTGYEDDTFKPEKSINRSEMAALICRLLEKEDDVNKALVKTNFTDVNLEFWANKYINVAVKLGVISGDGDGTFRPEDDVKYEEAIKMLICALGFGENVAIDPSDWSAGYIAVANAKGITKGLKGTKGEPASRADIAVMIHNALTMDLKPPTASLPAGTYDRTQEVTLSTDLEYGAIYYTTDGTTPTMEKADKYSKPITIKDSCTLKAIVVKDGAIISDVMSVDYIIERNINNKNN